MVTGQEHKRKSAAAAAALADPNVLAGILRYVGEGQHFFLGTVSQTWLTVSKINSNATRASEVVQYRNRLLWAWPVMCDITRISTESFLCTYSLCFAIGKWSCPALIEEMLPAVREVPVHS